MLQKRATPTLELFIQKRNFVQAMWTLTVLLKMRESNLQEVSDARRLHIEKKRKEKQMEEDRLVLIEQLRQNRQEKRDLAYERVLVVNENKIRLMDIPEDTMPPNLASIEESVDDTKSRVPTNTKLRNYVLARKQCRRNSPNEKQRILAVSKISGKMSAMNQLFGRSRNVDDIQGYKKTESP